MLNTHELRINKHLRISGLSLILDGQFREQPDPPIGSHASRTRRETSGNAVIMCGGTERWRASVSRKRWRDQFEDAYRKGRTSANVQRTIRELYSEVTGEDLPNQALL